MDNETLEKIRSQMMARAAEYDKNEAYVEGKNPTILKTPSAGKPDNRIPIPLAKMAVDDICGYAGRSEDIQITFDSVDADGEDDNADRYRKVVRRWMDYNSDGIETAELYREGVSQGKAYELFWTSEGTDAGFPIIPEYKIVTGSSVYIKYTNTLKPVKEYAVRFWTDEDIDYAMVYYPFYAEGYQKSETGAWARNEELDLVYPYQNVPVIEYKINRKGKPIYEAEKELIDAVDKAVGKSVNEIDRFNALILLFPGLADAGIKAKLMELKILDDLDQFTKNPEYLAKDLNGVTEFYKWVEELLEKSFRKSIKIPDMTDQNFGGNDESGVARAFKLLGMEYVASGIETYFKQGLYERKQFFDDCINAGTSGIDTESMTINVNCKRNLPVDEKTKVELAVMLKALGVSDDTAFRVLPSTLIHDVDKELEMKATENQGAVQLLQGEE